MKSVGICAALGSDLNFPLFGPQRLCEDSHTKWKPIKVRDLKNICLECLFFPSYSVLVENILSGTKYSTGPITS